MSAQRDGGRAPFASLYSHGFARVAAAVPHMRVADPRFNARRTIALARRASEQGAALVAFPELGLCGYTSDDLFHQDALLEAVLEALSEVVAASAELAPLIFLGAPLLAGQQLFNAAVAIQGGEVLAVVPKSYLPNYREFYERRWFSAARDALGESIELLGREVPFGADLLLACRQASDLIVHVEVCEDLWVPIPPSAYGALAGATVLVNLSASNITVAKADYRRMLCSSHSARTMAGHVFVAAGAGESTTDMAWDGQAMVHENGELLGEAERFAAEEQLVLADLDLERLRQDRMRMTSFADCARDERERSAGMRRIEWSLQQSPRVVELSRRVERFPYVPADPHRRDERCAEVYNIQVQGLTTRLRATGIEKVVIGVSGGLDSAQALIVCARAMDRLGLPREHVLAYTMPGFATSALTLENAHRLMAALGVSAAEIDIRPSATLMLKDIGHPAGEGQPVHDVTFENVQAGERTSHLFRLANRHGALVVGTGDLSELALGWSTYGVGDQMSHYAVNASVPKSLIRFLIAWEAERGVLGAGASEVLRSVLDTVISPELIPAGGDAAADEPSQESERIVGPFELQDFFLYYTLRFGYRPSKVAFLAHHAWRDRERGAWPAGIAPERRNEYTLAEIKHWLEVFLERFFGTSQFKRSAIPNAPKVGSGGSLSPRGDWRAPSDGSAEPWLAELRANVPDSL